MNSLLNSFKIINNIQKNNNFLKIMKYIKTLLIHQTFAFLIYVNKVIKLMKILKNIRNKIKINKIIRYLKFINFQKLY